jgi:hypothetical protein
MRAVASMRRLAWSVVLPLAVYATALIVLQPATLRRFWTRLFADEGDGLQCYWNLWWVDLAVTRLHQWPWFTDRLHYPHGTTLIGHTLHPLSGFLAIALQRIVPLAQAYNLLVIQSFVLGGLAMFWLARAWGASWAGALFGGAVYTFSEFHFAHATGHLQLASIEWIALFLLAWTRLLARPGPVAGAVAGVALLLVVLGDYYYFGYAVVVAAILLGARVVGQRRDLRGVCRRLAPALGVFLAVAGATAGVVVVALLRSNHQDPLGGSHPAGALGLDLSALLVPGWEWRFASLTVGAWARIPNAYETMVHPSIAVSALASYAWWRRRDLRGRGVGAWSAVFAVGLLLSIGPVVRLAGHTVAVVGPYGLLERLVPALRLSGVPARALLLAVVAGAMLAAAALPLLWHEHPWIAATVLAVFVVESLPRPMVTTVLEVPQWVQVLAAEPDAAALVDRVTPAPWSLFFQTIHGKPMAEGYLARIPQSVSRRDRVIVHLHDRGKFPALCRRFGIRYVVLPVGRDTGAIRVLWQDAREKLIAIAPPGRCHPAPTTRPHHKTTKRTLNGERETGAQSLSTTSRGRGGAGGAPHAGHERALRPSVLPPAPGVSKRSRRPRARGRTPQENAATAARRRTTCHRGHPGAVPPAPRRVPRARRSSRPGRCRAPSATAPPRAAWRTRRA